MAIDSSMGLMEPWERSGGRTMERRNSRRSLFFYQNSKVQALHSHGRFETIIRSALRPREARQARK